MKRPISDSDLLQLADLNRVEFWCQSSRCIPGTEILQSLDTVYINTSLNFPACNLVFNLATESTGRPDDFLQRAKDFFATKKPMFSLLLRGHSDSSLIQYCKENKEMMIGEVPGMVLDEPVGVGALPGGAELRWVEEEQGLRDFQKVVSEAFSELGFPQEIGARYFDDAKRVLNPHSILTVVYFEGEPASAAMATLSHGIGGVYWVGTTKKTRGKGFGEHCTRVVGDAAFDLGARKVILQASKFGEPVYRKIGYREITRYPWFVCASK
jgi:hypothetical protein